MNKAEERALEAYPKLLVASVCLDGTSPVDLNTGARKRFIEGYETAEKDLADKAKYSSGWDGFFYGKGYEQAEKDLALTWEDIKTIVQILADSDWYDFEINGKLWSEDFYKEVLKRYEQKRNHQ